MTKGEKLKAVSTRFLELEGLRGIAAIAVVIFHFLVLFYPGMFYGVGHSMAPVQHMRFEDNLFGLPTGAFISGAFAVAIFFVLSGFVLTIGYFQTGDTNIIKKLATKRYLRLMLPAAVSIFLVWFILSFGLDANKNIAEGISLAGSSSSLWTFNPNFFEALWQGILGIFTSSLNAAHYNPVLWTMQYEFLGSFLVFLIALLFGKSKNRWIVYLFAGIFTFNTWYVGFIIGMVLADLYVHRNRFYQIVKNKMLILFLALAALFLGGYPYARGAAIYDWLSLGFLSESHALILYLTIAASVVVYLSIALPPLSKFLRKSWISILGKYTFALYLTHLLVLFTIYPTVFVLLEPKLGYNIAVLLSIIITTPFVAGVAWLFEKYIDSPSIAFSGRFARWFLK